MLMKLNEEKEFNASMEIKTTGSKCKQWINGLLANSLVFTYGMQSGWMSPNIVILQGPESPSGYPLSDMQISLVASTIAFVAVFFSMGYSFAADIYGRKISLILVAVPQAFAWIIKLISADPTCLIVSQGFAGIAGAGVFSIAPLYTKEIASDSIRGAMGGFGMLMQSVGILTMYAMGAYLYYYTVLWIVVWIPILNALLILFTAPETPPYLIKRGQIEEAKSTISFLTGLDIDDNKVINAVDELKKAQSEFDNLPKITIRRVFADKACRRGFYLGLFMMSLLDFGGNFAIFSYASVIIRKSGVTIQPALQALSFPAVMIVGSMISSITVEKFGRKPLLISSILINGIPMIVLGVVLLLFGYGYTVVPWIPVACVVLSVFAYGSGVLPIPYIVITEIFNFQIRAKILGFYVSYGWFLCFLQNIIFTPISKALGMHSIFFIFGSINVLSAVLCIIWMPETKGKSLGEIQKKLCAK